MTMQIDTPDFSGVDADFSGARTQFVRSGLLTAQIVETPAGVAFVGAVEFDEQLVAEGRWEFAGIHFDNGRAVADALDTLYLRLFDAWVAREAAERAAAMPAMVARARANTSGGVDTRFHRPDPALWAGR